MFLTYLEVPDLQRLYECDGAWTPAEARRMHRFVELVERGVLIPVHTSMGLIYHLGQEGRRLLRSLGRISAHHTTSLSVQTNRAYLRWCLRDLGWTVCEQPESWTTGLRNWMHFVSTPGGTVIVGALYDGDGISRTAIQQIGQDMRSQCLVTGIDVILLTPHKVKGQRAAAAFPNHLRLLHHLPQTESGRNGSRRFIQGEDTVSPDGPYGTLRHQTVLDWFNDPLWSALSLETLALPRQERIERALQAIRTDRVLGETQLQRHYGLLPGDLRGVPCVEHLIRPIHGNARTEVKHRFYYVDRRYGTATEHVLGHLAATAELRQMLGVRPGSDWQVIPRVRQGREAPDALWISRQTAIEYDTGGYDPLTILRKLDSYQDQGYGVIWGVASEVRRRHLQRRIGARVQGEVRLVRWWELPYPKALRMLL